MQNNKTEVINYCGEELIMSDLLVMQNNKTEVINYFEEELIMSDQ